MPQVTDETLIELARAALARKADEPRALGVMFQTQRGEGWFAQVVTVLFDDNTTKKVDLGRTAETSPLTCRDCETDPASLLYEKMLARYRYNEHGLSVILDLRGDGSIIEYPEEIDDVRMAPTLRLRNVELITKAVKALDALDWTDSAVVDDLIRRLPESTRVALTDSIDTANSAQRDAEMITIVATVLNEQLPGLDVAGVAFTAVDHPNGRLVDQVGTVVFTDLTTRKIDFGPRMATLLTMEYGHIGRLFVVTIDLRCMQVTGDDIGPGYGLIPDNLGDLDFPRLFGLR